MQALILAGGESSRFYPFNDYGKALFPLLGEPVIVHTIRAIKRGGINDVVILTGPDNQIKKYVENGKKYGVKVTYTEIPSPTGMGDGILHSLKALKSDFFLVNPQQVNFDELKKEIDRKRQTNSEVVLLARKGGAEKKYGMLKIDGDKVLRVVEKPDNDTGFSNLRIVGVYFLNQDFIKVLKSVKKDHYSFESALDEYAKLGKVRVSVTDMQTVSLKYPWDTLSLKDFLFSKLRRRISKKADISKSAKINGDVIIEEGAHVADNAVVNGPAYLGKNTLVGTNSLIRNGVDLEEGVKIGSLMEVKNTILLRGATTHSGFIGDSIIGEGSKIGAGFNSANTRLDRGIVKSVVKGQETETGFRKFGLVMGAGCVVGSRVTTMPGIIVGRNVNIGPSTTVMKNVESDTVYYTKFKEIVEKKKN